MKIYRTLLCILALVLLTSTCACQKEEWDHIDVYAFPVSEHEEYIDELLKPEEYDYTEDVIPDKETAIEVAYAIYKSSEWASEGYVPQVVFYSKEKGIWEVSFWRDGQEDTVGGCVSIILSQKNGQVLRMYPGE